jgi:hypothetical protein
MGPSQGLAWSSSPPGNLTSLQYNPDYAQSFWYQNSADWFQTGIISDSNGCAIFTIQVYNLITGLEGYNTYYPSNGCASVFGILRAEAGWYIREDMTNNVITDVYFELWGFGGYPYSTTIYPLHNWIWIRSNMCWCGTDLGSTTFTTAGGTLYYTSNQHLVTEDPPVQISTAENSNMQYGCFQNAGTTMMYQSYDLSGHC